MGGGTLDSDMRAALRNPNHAGVRMAEKAARRTTHSIDMTYRHRTAYPGAICPQRTRSVSRDVRDALKRLTRASYLQPPPASVPLSHATSTGTAYDHKVHSTPQEPPRTLRSTKPRGTAELPYGEDEVLPGPVTSVYRVELCREPRPAGSFEVLESPDRVARNSTPILQNRPATAQLVRPSTAGRARSPPAAGPAAAALRRPQSAGSRSAGVSNRAQPTERQPPPLGHTRASALRTSYLHDELLTAQMDEEDAAAARVPPRVRPATAGASRRSVASTSSRGTDGVPGAADPLFALELRGVRLAPARWEAARSDQRRAAQLRGQQRAALIARVTQQQPAATA